MNPPREKDVWRCTPCDEYWPDFNEFNICPICKKSTWRTTVPLDTEVPNIAQAKKHADQVLFEQRIAAEQEADLLSARKIARTTFASARIIAEFTAQLMREPTANRFAIPPEERCPKYEAKDNPYPTNPWRPPAEAQDVSE